MNIKTMRKSHVGRFVKYLPTGEMGRIKSWNDSYIFVVFNCDDSWYDYEKYTAQSCLPSDLKLTSELNIDKKE